MKAIVQQQYGPPDLLEVREVDQPTVGDQQVLVKVHAAAVRVGNLFTVLGSPFLVRASTGLRRPKQQVPGFDLAGEVTSVGAKVTTFRPGDEVFGVGIGAFAEYALAKEDELVLKPANLTFAEAAAIPTSALAALHGIRDAGKVKAGQRVLVNGASGGVGTFEVQIAKALGAVVTGVSSTRNLEMVRSIGADHVIDYTREDFTQAGPQYDVILDNVENRSLSAVRRALTPHGTLVLNSGTGAKGLGMLVRLVWPLILSPFASQRLVRYLSTPKKADLAELKKLVEEGSLRPVIDRTFRLSETPAALRHIESGRARGNVVIAVAA